MQREKIKTLILILLFFISIILFFLNFNNAKIDLNSMLVNNVSLEENLSFVFKPERIFIHFGGENNTEIIKNKDKYWDESKKILREILDKKEKLNKITYKEYLLKKDIKSIELVFPKGINGYYLTRITNLNNSGLQNLRSIKEILIPLVDDKGIYFLTAKNKVFKIKADVIKDVDFIKSLEKSQYLKYYTIDSFFPIKNKTLLPVEIKSSYPTIKSKNYFDLNNERDVQNIATAFFSKEKYPFTNRIIENDGTNTFIYGYGAKVLKLDKNGEVSYINENVDGKDLKEENSLIVALNFLRSIEVDVKNIYLCNKEEKVVQDKKVYTFDFSYLIKNLKVQSKDLKYPIEVKVVGDEICSYKGIYNKVEYNLNNDKIINPQEILNIRFNLFKKDLGYLRGEEVLENLKSVQLIYFLDNNNFIPAWHFIIGDRYYIFDAYKGESLKNGLVQG